MVRITKESRWTKKTIDEVRQQREQLLIMWQDICQHKEKMNNLRIKLQEIRTEHNQESRYVTEQEKQYTILMKKALDLPLR